MVQPPNFQRKKLPSLAPLRPRSMLFTLYGDYVYPGGGDIWLGSLVQIGAALGMSEVAVRSAVARLARERWIVARKNGNRSYYGLSATGRALIEEGTRRIYRTNGRRWDGNWCLLTYSIPESKRALRDRMRKRLAYLGFGAMGGGVYVAARDASADVHRLAHSLGAGDFARTFLAQRAGLTTNDQIVRECWELPRIAATYERFIRHYSPLLERDRANKKAGTLAPAQAFVMRFALTHDFRRFPFIDPDLPDSLLPKDWAGARGRRLFESYHAMLTGDALRFFATSTAAGSGG